MDGLAGVARLRHLLALAKDVLVHLARRVVLLLLRHDPRLSSAAGARWRASHRCGAAPGGARGGRARGGRRRMGGRAAGSGGELRGGVRRGGAAPSSRRSPCGSARPPPPSCAPSPPPASFSRSAPRTRATGDAWALRLRRAAYAGRGAPWSRRSGPIGSSIVTWRASARAYALARRRSPHCRSP